MDFLCDNCSIRCSNRLLKIIAEKGFAVITYQSHIRDLFQILDLLLFEQLKFTTT
jgi:hypothetical protein